MNSHTFARAHYPILILASFFRLIKTRETHQLTSCYRSKIVESEEKKHKGFDKLQKIFGMFS